MFFLNLLGAKDGYFIPTQFDVLRRILIILFEDNSIILYLPFDEMLPGFSFPDLRETFCITDLSGRLHWWWRLHGGLQCLICLSTTSFSSTL